jgi:hypothetical protein
MGIIVGGNEVDGPGGLLVKNFKDPAVFRFKNQARAPQTVTEIVVHETVTRSWSSTVDVLKQRGLGVHFIADHDGTIYQHADLLTDEMWHASQHNAMSVGIETVNPYQPNLNQAGSPWKNTIKGAWAAGGAYVVPTPEQSEAVCQLVDWLSSASANPLTVPQLWPGLAGSKRMALGRLASCKTPPEPGILAHMYWDHADGAWLVLYAWLRLEAKLDSATAYGEAMRRATDASSAGVDLSDYFTADPFLVA